MQRAVLFNLYRTIVRYRCGTVLDLHQIPRASRTVWCGQWDFSTLAPTNLENQEPRKLDTKQYNDTIVLVNYVTTNIRISEEDYLRLKAEAAKLRTSLSAVVREKIKSKQKTRTKAEVQKIMAETEKLARENAKYTKGFDSVKALREIRYHGKW